jgi:tetratricopeptide (TPR) repeat protein
MTSDLHYDDATLLALVDPALGPVAPAVTQHVAACSFCEREVRWLRTFTETMKDPQVWERDETSYLPPPERMRIVFDFAARLDFEDREAAERLPSLIEGPREWWHTKLARHPEYRTAGMVRKLIAATDRAIETVPADALAITNLAVEIADHLETATYPSDTVIKLRGGAWREKAFALYYVGRFQDALESIGVAEEQFVGAMITEHDVARVKLVRALILASYDRIAESFELAKASGDLFDAHGDKQRARYARSVEAITLLKAKQPREALAVWRELLQDLYGDAQSDPLTLAQTLHNVGTAEAELGNFEAAAICALRSYQYFDTAGVAPLRAKSRWLFARMLTPQGQHREAISTLHEVREEFERLEMAAEAALVWLDIAEALSLENDHNAVVEITRDLMKRFAASGLAHTDRALIALAYLHESASAARATPVAVRTVRRYLQNLPDNPQLLFLPPPS